VSADSGGAPEGSWREIFFGRYVVHTLVLNLGMTLFAINQFVVATLMPTVVADLGGVDLYTWAFSLFAVGAIIGSASAGPLRDALGTRLAFAGAGLVLGAGLAGAALAPDMPTFVLFRLIQGIGGGAVASQGYGLVAVVYPPELRSRALGVISTVWGIATAIGPGFGGAFANPAAWPWAFWTLVPFAVAFAALAWRHGDAARGHGKLGEIPYVRLGLLALAILVMSAPSLALPNWARGGLIACALALVALTFAQDARAPRRMFPRRIAAVATEFGAMYAVILLVSIVLAFINTYTTFFVQVLHGVDPFTAGYLFAVQSFMWTVGALIVAGGRAALERPFIVFGLAMLLAASGAIALIVDRGSVVAIAAALAVSGTGIGFMNNPTTQRVMALASEAERHAAGASVQSIRNIGVSFGAAFAGMVAAVAGLADGADRETIAHAMRWVYAVNAAFAALPLLLVLAIAAAWWSKRGSASPE
jgi:MFS family permease